MLPVTPRATVVQALARREAELLDQQAASGHVLVALIWEGGGLAARALADAGLPNGANDEVRQRLATASKSERGTAAMDLQGLAGRIAAELGHPYVGTEHQLLALTRDDRLSEKVLEADVRRRAAARVTELLPSGTDG